MKFHLAFVAGFILFLQERGALLPRVLPCEEGTIETTYNEQGDTAIEITGSERVTNEKEPDTPASTMFPFSEVRHSYQYDDRGNWTEEVTSHRFNPNGTFESSSIRRRTLTYY